MDTHNQDFLKSLQVIEADGGVLQNKNAQNNLDRELLEEKEKRYIYILNHSEKNVFLIFNFKKKIIILNACSTVLK